MSQDNQVDISEALGEIHQARNHYGSTWGQDVAGWLEPLGIADPWARWAPLDLGLGEDLLFTGFLSWEPETRIRALEDIGAVNTSGLALSVHMRCGEHIRASMRAVITTHPYTEVVNAEPVVATAGSVPVTLPHKARAQDRRLVTDLTDHPISPEQQITVLVSAIADHLLTVCTDLMSGDNAARSTPDDE